MSRWAMDFITYYQRKLRKARNPVDWSRCWPSRRKGFKRGGRE